jgi:hypothetical protein
MKNPIFLFAALTALSLLQSGCNRSVAAAEAGADHAAPVACTFKAGHGLEVAPAAAEFIGLRTAEFTGELPAAALLRTVKGDFVYVANNGRLLRTAVKVSALPSGAFRVEDGLYEGDVIAVGAVKNLWLAELQATNGGVGCADGH